ncbi:MAG: alanine racemase [Proteobacteria bacterium]|nr:alanine racemase [Pseudomonadota bacterium]
MRLADLSTPSLVLDRRRLARNTAAVTERLKRFGVALRPHMKTAKSIDVARIATAGNFGGITVSTLKEAEYFAGNGISDIQYAVCITPAKLEQVAGLMRRGVRMTVLTDDLEAARAIGACGVALGARFEVLIEVDCGERRSGVMPESRALLDIGAVLHNSPGAKLMGVLTHAGHSYACRSPADAQRVAEEERRAAVRAAEHLRAEGLPAPVVTMGSTPTALHGTGYDGVTEVRCGVYMFGDLFQAEIGSCARDDIAVSVLASVIGHRPADNRLLIDAGALALSKDRSTEATLHDAGFGTVLDAGGGGSLGALTVTRVNQEHGIALSPSGGEGC